jgi:SAM-dependent methyltransferase
MMLCSPENDKNQWRTCPSCDASDLTYIFKISDHHVVECASCGLMGINPQPSDDTLAKIYGPSYFPLSGSDAEVARLRSLKEKTAEQYLDLLEDYIDRAGRKISECELLEVGSGLGDFLLAASKRCAGVVGIEYSAAAVESARSNSGKKAKIYQGEITDLPVDAKFDIVVFNDVLEHVRNPLTFLQRVHHVLAPGGFILCVIPSLDSWSARLQKSSWVEFKLEHLYYFNNANARHILYKSGFNNIGTFPSKKVLSIEYIAEHFMRHPRRFWTWLFKLAKLMLPKVLIQKHFSVVASGIVLVGAKKPIQQSMSVTVIMAVFNEASTVRQAIEGVLAKTIPNVDLDLVIVESNSSDGTREIVESFADIARVRIILQDVPLGKGNAIRAGLSLAQGDVVLIQDADLEYDFDDYDALIEPIRDGGCDFVLGSRHGGGRWKVRHFDGQPMVGFLANAVHWGLTFIINVMFRVRLTDPFTMYKVFRRAAIQGLSFSANRFDFDYEILLKLIRRGYYPKEVPVNYKARSFKQGKKVRFFRDPITWVWAIVKYRICKL